MRGGGRGEREKGGRRGLRELGGSSPSACSGGGQSRARGPARIPHLRARRRESARAVRFDLPGSEGGEIIQKRMAKGA